MIADDNHRAGYWSNLEVFLTAKCIDLSLIIHYSTYFKDKPILLLSIQSGVHLMEVFNDRNEPNTIYFSVGVSFIEVSAE